MLRKLLAEAERLKNREFLDQNWSHGRFATKMMFLEGGKSIVETVLK